MSTRLHSSSLFSGKFFLGTQGDGISCIANSDSQNNCDMTLQRQKCELWSKTPNFQNLRLRENLCTKIATEHLEQQKSYWCFARDGKNLIKTECSQHCNICNPNHENWHDNWLGDGFEGE